MTHAPMSRAALAELVVRFTEAFNREDLDEVMSYMAEDAMYDEFNGQVNHGKSAIRQAFVPQFRGDYGIIRFHTEDLLLDAEAGKALIRWTCTLRKHGRCRGWRGLDILHVANGLVQAKLTYAKTEVLLLQPHQESGTATD